MPYRDSRGLREERYTQHYRPNRQAENAMDVNYSKSHYINKEMRKGKVDRKAEEEHDYSRRRTERYASSRINNNDNRSSITYNEKKITNVNDNKEREVYKYYETHNRPASSSNHRHDHREYHKYKNKNRNEDDVDDEYYTHYHDRNKSRLTAENASHKERSIHRSYLHDNDKDDRATDYYRKQKSSEEQYKSDDDDHDHYHYYHHRRKSREITRQAHESVGHYPQSNRNENEVVHKPYAERERNYDSTRINTKEYSYHQRDNYNRDNGTETISVHETRRDEHDERNRAQGRIQGTSNHRRHLYYDYENGNKEHGTNNETHYAKSNNVFSSPSFASSSTTNTTNTTTTVALPTYGEWGANWTREAIEEKPLRRLRDDGKSYTRRVEVGPRKRLRAGEHNERRRERWQRTNREEIAFLPRVPIDFHCHICGLNHWTVECQRLREQPNDYPMMDARRGCWKCAQRGHTAALCTVRKYKCNECGGMHDTKDCAFDHVGEEWHEFYDVVHHHTFYCKADDGQVQWQPPSHELDVILWYCPSCSSLIPHRYNECLKCHAIRPSLQQHEQQQKLKLQEEESDSSSSSSSDSDNDDNEEMETMSLLSSSASLAPSAEEKSSTSTSRKMTTKVEDVDFHKQLVTEKEKIDVVQMSNKIFN